MSSIHQFIGNKQDFLWEGVKKETPISEGLKLITKQILVGSRDGAPHFSMRYFCLEPGGHTKLEKHAHEHGVIILHGKGKVRLGDIIHDLSPLDSIFISGDDLHQFTNPFNESFGFICVIPIVE